MSLKQVELNPEDSKAFVELLKADADPETIAAFLEGRNPIDIPEKLVKTMQLIADLETLQEDEKNILGKIFAVREQIMNDLTIELLGTQNPALDRSTTIPGTGSGLSLTGEGTKESETPTPDETDVAAETPDQRPE